MQNGASSKGVAAEATVLNPVAAVTLASGRRVDVHELTWKDYLRAVKMLTASIADLTRGLPPDGKPSVEAVLGAITAQEANVDFLVKASTALTPEEAAQLSGLELLGILECVVALNMSPEVLEQGKKLAARLSVAFASSSPSPGRSTTSSPGATPSAT